MGHSGGTDQCNNQEATHAIDHSISPGVSCPETVLVTRMTDGSYLLMSYPHRERAAFVVRDDAGPLRQALHAVLGSSVDEITCVNYPDNGMKDGVLGSGSLTFPEHSVEPYWSREPQ